MQSPVLEHSLSTPAKPRKNRTLYLVLGWTCVVLGLVGLALPAMPSTIFFILALACAKRSSERLESWLLNHPKFGQVLRDWDETRSLTKRTKWIAIVAIWACILVSCLLTKKPQVWTILILTALSLTTYLCTRKTKIE